MAESLQKVTKIVTALETLSKKISDEVTKVYDHEICVNHPWFTLIADGRKKFDGRAYWKKILTMKTGDILKLTLNLDEKKGAKKDTENKPPIYKRIGRILRYRNFEEALQTLGLEDTLPTVTTLQEGIEIYNKYVSPKTQLENGVCMIELLNI
jgi:ASC-1-like (ASCH) protein